jgi:hypothetical protein
MTPTQRRNHACLTARTDCPLELGTASGDALRRAPGRSRGRTFRRRSSLWTSGDRQQRNVPDTPSRQRDLPPAPRGSRRPGPRHRGTRRARRSRSGYWVACRPGLAGRTAPRRRPAHHRAAIRGDVVASPSSVRLPTTRTARPAVAAVIAEHVQPHRPGRLPGVGTQGISPAAGRRDLAENLCTWSSLPALGLRLTRSPAGRLRARRGLRGGRVEPIGVSGPCQRGRRRNRSGHAACVGVPSKEV